MLATIDIVGWVGDGGRGVWGGRDRWMEKNAIGLSSDG